MHSAFGICFEILVFINSPAIFSSPKFSIYRLVENAIKGTELFTIIDIEKGIDPRAEVSCEIKYLDGSSKTIKLLSRIDTENEIEYYKNGGILQYVLRNMIS